MVSLCQILARRAPFAGVWVASTDWLPHRPSELWKHGRKLGSGTRLGSFRNQFRFLLLVHGNVLRSTYG